MQVYSKLTVSKAESRLETKSPSSSVVRIRAHENRPVDCLSVILSFLFNCYVNYFIKTIKFCQ